MNDDLYAYVVGGEDNDDVSCVKQCLRFDIRTQKFQLFGILNKPRLCCGAMKNDKYLWVYGGYDGRYN